jgi:perosamine synthetase
MDFRIPLSKPFLTDLEADYVKLSIESGWITQSGKYVESMENIIGNHIYGSDSSCGVTTTSNGTTALHLVLMALEVGPGDEVVVPDFGYIAPVNAVLMCGAIPVLLDVDIDSWCLDPNLVTSALSDKTKAVIAIDNYGKRADIGKIKELIPNQIQVIEDAAESFPSLMQSTNKLYGGDFVTTSFYANKIVTSAEGGAITGPENYIKKIKSLKSQSIKSPGSYEHIDIGYNYRLSNLHAALFNAQWIRLPDILRNRMRVYEHYFKCLTEAEIKFESNQYPKIENPWLMTIRLLNSTCSIKSIRQQLAQFGIETRPGFKPASQHDYLKAKITTPLVTKNSHKLYEQVISLPTFPELSNKEIEFIVGTLSGILNNKK